MSAANAAAIRRRAAGASGNNTPTPASTQKTDNSSQQRSGLTLQQIISTFDKRLKTLEEGTTTFSKQSTDSIPPNVIIEFNSRFEIIANEIADLKNALLKLQTFTMEVNKSLHDDRIRVLSDVNISDEIGNTVTFSLDESDVTASTVTEPLEENLNDDKNNLDKEVEDK
jgi:hypothetical protein